MLVVLRWFYLVSLAYPQLLFLAQAIHVALVMRCCAFVILFMIFRKSGLCVVSTGLRSFSLVAVRLQLKDIVRRTGRVDLFERRSEGHGSQWLKDEETHSELVGRRT